MFRSRMGCFGTQLAACAAIALAFALWPDDTLAQGCAMCRTYLGGPEDPRAAGFRASILFLMSMPFVLTASVGGWLAYMSRRRGAAPRGLHTHREEMP